MELPFLSKKIPMPGIVEIEALPKAGARWSLWAGKVAVFSWLSLPVTPEWIGDIERAERICEGAIRSEASARHWFSLPKRQRTKMLERRIASTSVNHAPSGTFVAAEERYRPSKLPNTRKAMATIVTGRRQIMIATRQTIQVVMKVTKMTQTP